MPPFAYQAIETMEPKQLEFPPELLSWEIEKSGSQVPASREFVSQKEVSCCFDNLPDPLAVETEELRQW